MKNVLLWFRNDLRTIDHQGLTEAAKAEKVIAVYCFDPR
ncbi:MAG: deoxyribodipyrimidine photo-lyase, partial [Bacteroidota bacterium]